MKLISPILITLNNTLHIKADNLEPVEVDSSCVDDFRNIAHIEWLNTECSLTFGEYLRRNKFDISELSDRIEVREIYIHKRENLNNFVYRAFLLPEKEDELSELLEIVDKKSYTIEEIEKAFNKEEIIKALYDCVIRTTDPDYPIVEVRKFEDEFNAISNLFFNNLKK